MPDVAILGATGYTALELLKILARHPEVQVTALTSRQDEKKHLREVHPQLTGLFDLRFENLTPAQTAARAKYVFCCLPHGASMEAVPELLAHGARVIDLSADYRLSDPGVYEEWYHLVHTDPTRLGSTVYGLPELFADKIPQSDLVANPGCYTSTSILGLAPLLCEDWIEPSGIIIDAKSGASGAGRKLQLSTLFSECNENFTAYGVGTHRHTPEIEQVLSQVSGKEVHVIFTPHLIPMDRGIFCTMYPKLKREASEAEIRDLYRRFYEGKPFIRIVDHIPATKHVAYTNYCDIGIKFSRGQLIVFSVTDNLIKGASGVAVQNFNLMLGVPETTALS
jgi:N-acetyl-gamma-glutamyl-phosphate reductase